MSTKNKSFSSAANVKPGQTQRLANKQIDKVISYLQVHCSDALNVFIKEKQFLYRGIGDGYVPPGPIFISHPELNRQPKDSSVDAQSELDQLLHKEGFTALRSNSIFCSGNASQASEYGSVYFIFPVNGFSYTWNTKEADIILDRNVGITGSVTFPTTQVSKVNFLVSTISSNKINKTQPIEYAKFLKLLKTYRANHRTWTKKSSLTASRSLNFSLRNLFLFGADLLLNIDKDQHDNYLTFANRIKLDSKKLPSVKQLGFLNTNLATAIQSYHEIMIHGNYIAVQYGYRTQLLEKLLIKK